MFEEKDNTLLARWLAGTLTPEEQNELEQSPGFKDYLQIVNGMNRFEKPYFDKESLRISIKEKINISSKTKVLRLKPVLYAASVAASVILIIGIFFNEVSYMTKTGEQLTFTLPNGAKVQMNAGSELSHARFFWHINKKVTLQGEAFFETETGNGFHVETELGMVSVLGTRFNVKARANLFELKCYKGKVAFYPVNDQQEIIVTKGESVKLTEGIFNEKTMEESGPDWINGHSSFNNTPLDEVLEELQIQYGITIENTGVDLSKHFTGSFVHDNLNMALRTILEPMGINYQLSNDQKIVTLLQNSLDN